MCGTACADHCGAQSFHYDLYCSGPVSFNLYRGLSYKFIGTVLVILIPTAIIFLAIVVQPNQPFLQDYQQERILAFLEPEKYADNGAYQQRNSVMAIGSGQLTGKGLIITPPTLSKRRLYPGAQHGTLSSLLSAKNLASSESCIIIALLLLIVIQCILIGIRSQNLSGRIIC